MNKQFEEWFQSHGFIKKSDGFISYGKRTKFFNQLPFSMQWGVYLEFFDSVGIIITIQHYFVGDYLVLNIRGKEEVVHYNGADFASYYNLDERQQAQQEAIKKAFEILEQDEK